jgi:hypothetical protein
LRVVCRGGVFRVRFGSATNASHYLVRVTGSDGRRQLKVIGTGSHRLSFAARGYTDRLTVTVTGEARALALAGGAHEAEGAQGGHDQQDDRPKRADHTDHGQHQPDHSERAGTATDQGETVGPRLASPPRGVAAATIKIAHAL